jgi:hypothetical protein
MKAKFEQDNLFGEDGDLTSEPQRDDVSSDSDNGKLSPKRRRKTIDDNATPRRETRRVTLPNETFEIIERIVQAVNGAGPLKTTPEDVVGMLAERFGATVQEELRQQNINLKRRRREKGDGTKTE